MFKLCLDNGLPAKPYKFVDHFDDLEETDEHKQKKTNNDLEKIIVINFQDIDISYGSLLDVHFINQQLWIEMDSGYVVCDKLSNNTLAHIKDHKFINLGFLMDDRGTVRTLDKIQL
tara:strand:- start:195 stop:542 length:348 start_codon:yes stop_codon:yes gene_type:complete